MGVFRHWTRLARLYGILTMELACRTMHAIKQGLHGYFPKPVKHLQTGGMSTYSRMFLGCHHDLSLETTRVLDQVRAG